MQSEAHPKAMRSLAAGFVALSTVCAAVLGIKHITGAALPGCGPGSACDEAARTIWGRIPGIDWPISFLGLAYFAAALAAWIVARGQPDSRLRGLIRLGALISAGYLIVIVVGRHFCPYCIAAHVCNLGFWILAERASAGPRPSAPVWACAGAVFLLVTAGLAVAEYFHRAAEREKSLREAAESTQRIIAYSSRAGASTAPAPSTAGSPATTQSAAPTTAPSAPATRPSSPFPRGFTGRWRLGPEKAAIRIVVCSDYQCPACKQVESELRQLLKTRTDLSVSMKHYPVCTDCNRYMPKTMHANACWAARCAETAGILRGNDGFWEMHFALFDRRGAFTDQQLVELLAQLKYDPVAFQIVMKSDEPLHRIKQDIDDAMAVGMRYTPLVMINGVEFRGWETPGAIAKAVAQLVATNPPALGAEADQPPAAVDTLVAEWKKEPPRELPLGKDIWWTGPVEAKVEIVVFADYQEPTVARLDAAIRDEMKKRGSIRYAILQYPFAKECNPTVDRTEHTQACWASKAALAAGRLGGAAGYWKMHDWLLSHQSSLNDSALLTAAPQLGFDGIGLLAEIQKPDVAARIRDECNAAKRLGLSAIPTVYVNRKPVGMWDYYGQNILASILDAAAAQ